VADPVDHVPGEPLAIAGRMRAAPAVLAPARDPRRRDWRFPSSASSLRALRRELRPFLSSTGLPENEVDDLVLAACEAAANSVEHAGQSAEPFFDVQAESDGQRVRIVIRDHGRWTPRRDGCGDRGRGLHMMTRLAAVTLTSGRDGTSVTLRSLVDGTHGR
jgi:anti-sigma regulatory factor (Ser/Thr protein kinase)